MAARWVAWSLCAAVFAGVLCVFGLMHLNVANFATSGIPFLGLASAVVGALVSSRQPRNLVGWFFLASASFATIRALFGEYGVYGIETSPGAPLAEAAAWLSIAIGMPGERIPEARRVRNPPGVGSGEKQNSAADASVRVRRELIEREGESIRGKRVESPPTPGFSKEFSANPVS